MVSNYLEARARDVIADELTGLIPAESIRQVAEQIFRGLVRRGWRHHPETVVEPGLNTGGRSKNVAARAAEVRAQIHRTKEDQ